MCTTVVMISFAELDTGVHCCTVKTELDVSQKEHGEVQCVCVCGGGGGLLMKNI